MPLIFDPVNRLQVLQPLQCGFHWLPGFRLSTTRSNSATRNSTFSIPIALDEWFITYSGGAHLHRGLDWSTITLSSVVAAADADQCDPDDAAIEPKATE